MVMAWFPCGFETRLRWRWHGKDTVKLRHQSPLSCFELSIHLGICGIGTLVCAYELIPKLNEWLGMVTLPDDQLRSTILVMLLIDIFGCLLWDRAMIALFAPKIFRASMEATSVQEMIRGAGKLVVSGGAIWLLVNDGGIVSILIIFWLYRSGFF